MTTEPIAIPSPESRQQYLCDDVVGGGAQPDPVVSEAVRRLMPWRAGQIGSLSSLLAISES